jgi:hypothetical protein
MQAEWSLARALRLNGLEGASEAYRRVGILLREPEGGAAAITFRSAGEDGLAVYPDGLRFGQFGGKRFGWSTSRSDYSGSSTQRYGMK